MSSTFCLPANFFDFLFFCYHRLIKIAYITLSFCYDEEYFLSTIRELERRRINFYPKDLTIFSMLPFWKEAYFKLKIFFYYKAILLRIETTRIDCARFFHALEACISCICRIDKIFHKKIKLIQQHPNSK